MQKFLLSLCVFVLSGVLLTLCSFGTVEIYERMTGNAFFALPVDDRVLIPSLGLLVGISCLLFLAPLYRLVSVNEILEHGERRARQHWEDTARKTKDHLHKWVAEQGWSNEQEIAAHRHLRDQPTESFQRLN